MSETFIVDTFYHVPSLNSLFFFFFNNSVTLILIFCEKIANIILLTHDDYRGNQ